MQRSVRQPTHVLHTSPIDMRLVGFAIGELGHAHGRSGRTVIQRHPLINAQGPPAIDPFLQLLEHGRRQFLSHDHRDRRL